MSKDELLIEELEHWLEQAKYFEGKLAWVEKKLEVVMRERDAYKAYIDKIVQLKTEALLTQPLPPIFQETPPRAGDTLSPVGSYAEGKVETPCWPTEIDSEGRFVLRIKPKMVKIEEERND